MQTEQPHPPPQNLLFRLLHLLQEREEGGILLLGITLSILYAAILGYVFSIDPKQFHALVALSASNMLLGRAGGLSLGFGMGLDSWLVITMNLLLETILVLLVYPLFVLGWKSVLARDLPWLHQFSASLMERAERHRSLIMRYGIPGLFFFVFFPFWATGPTMGSILGYFMRLPPWVNMAVVIGGTNLAILMWAFIIKQLEIAAGEEGRLGLWILIIGLCILSIGGFLFRYLKQKHP